VDDAPNLEPAAPGPRFVVTSLGSYECKAKYLYEKVYCARGDMENRIKECQLDLYADRTSTATMRANQPRLWFASMAYVLICALRRIGLHDTDFARATCGTIRLKLLKIGAKSDLRARPANTLSASKPRTAFIYICSSRRVPTLRPAAQKVPPESGTYGKSTPGA